MKEQGQSLKKCINNNLLLYTTIKCAKTKTLQILFLFSAFVALLTAQLREDCSEFPITLDQESWIGKIFEQNMQRLLNISGIRCTNK